MKFSITFIALLLLSVCSVAQQLQDSLKTYKLNEVVVTAQYSPRRYQKSLYRLRLINSEELRDRSVNNLGELLYQELNISMEQRSVFGASAEIQGMSGQNVKVLIDGVPVVGRINGILDLSQIELDAVKKIEIVEGPTSVFYGTDAMAGTINLITENTQKKAFRGRVTAYAESAGACKFSAGLGFMKNNSRLNASAGGYLFAGLPANEGTGSRAMQWEPRKQYFGNLRYAHWLGDVKIHYTARFFKEMLSKPGEPDTSNIAKDIYYHTRRIDHVLSAHTELNPGKMLDFTLAYLDHYRYSNTFLTEVTSNTRMLSEKATDHDTTRYGMVFMKGQFSNEVHENTSFVLGMEINLEYAQGRRILAGRQAMASYAAFAGMQYRLSASLQLQPGLRYTYNDAYGSLLSPALNLRFNFNEKNYLLASYARGFRAPSLKELYLDFSIAAGPFTYHIFGNTDLQAEKSHNFNLSFYGEIELSGENLLAIEPALYYNNIGHLIALSALVDYQRTYININQHKTKGGRLDVSWHAGKHFLAKAGIAFTGRYNAFAEIAPQELPGFVYGFDWNTQLRYHLAKQDLNLSLFYRYTGQTPAYAIENGTGNLIELRTPAHGLLDFTANKSFFHRQLRIHAGVKNLLNLKNLELVRTQTGEAHATDAFLWGRSYFTKLTWAF